jgi:hypothetical protein
LPHDHDHADAEFARGTLDQDVIREQLHFLPEALNIDWRRVPRYVADARQRITRKDRHGGFEILRRLVHRV